MLTGYRGVGKTFLLHKIIKETPNYYLKTFIDISEIYGSYKDKLTEESVLIELLERMNKSLKDYEESNAKKVYLEVKKLINNLRLNNYDFRNASGILKIPTHHTEKNYNKLSKFVIEFPQKLVENINSVKGFVIIMDEFQILNKLENPESFFWLIRSFNQYQSNVSYIFSTSTSNTSEIIEMLNGAIGTFEGRMIQINIEPFTMEETKTYFNERMPEIQFTDEGFKRFYKCTRGIPAYINSFYNLLSANVVYDENLIKETFLLNTDQILIMWVKIWGSLEAYEKNIILKMLDDEDYTWSRLEEKTGLSTSTLNKYLNNLQNKGIIEYYNKKYSLSDLMLKEWLKYEKKTRGLYPNYVG